MKELLLYGSFLWKNPLSLSCLAALMVSSEGLFHSETLHDGMVLDYSIKFDISVAFLNKLTKTQLAFPLDAEEIAHRLQGLHVLRKFFLKMDMSVKVSKS